jgi:hypothetical protein
MKICLQHQIDAAVSARTTICLGIAPLINPSANFRGGTVCRMADGTLNYTPPNDKLNPK